MTNVAVLANSRLIEVQDFLAARAEEEAVLAILPEADAAQMTIEEAMEAMSLDDERLYATELEIQAAERSWYAEGGCPGCHICVPALRDAATAVTLALPRAEQFGFWNGLFDIARDGGPQAVWAAIGGRA